MPIKRMGSYAGVEDQQRLRQADRDKTFHCVEWRKRSVCPRRNQKDRSRRRVGRTAGDDGIP